LGLSLSFQTHSQVLPQKLLETTIIARFTNRFESFALADGRSFTNVQVIFASLAGLTWRSTNGLGAGRIPLEKLPPGLLQRLGLAGAPIADALITARLYHRTNQMWTLAQQIYAGRLKDENDQWRWRVVNGQTNHTWGPGWYHVEGKVISVSDKSLLVHGRYSGDAIADRDRFFIVYNVPGSWANEDRLPPTRAKYTGTETYRNTLGALQTVRSFDHGLKCDPPGFDPAAAIRHLAQ
jgi:hypothetical protein